MNRLFILSSFMMCVLMVHAQKLVSIETQVFAQNAWNRHSVKYIQYTEGVKTGFTLLKWDEIDETWDLRSKVEYVQLNDSSRINNHYDLYSDGWVKTGYSFIERFDQGYCSESYVSTNGMLERKFRVVSKNTDSLTRVNTHFKMVAGDWVPSNKYKTKTKGGERIVETFSLLEDTWSLKRRVVYPACSDQKRIISYENWNNGSWIRDKRVVKVLENGITESACQTFDRKTGEWINQTKSIESFNENTNIRTQTHYRWSEEKLKWEAHKKIQYVFSDLEQEPKDHENRVEGDERVVLFPNPVRNELHVKTKSNEEAPIIYSLDGREVKLTMLRTNKEWLINTNTLPEGVYYVVSDGISLPFVKK